MLLSGVLEIGSDFFFFVALLPVWQEEALKADWKDKVSSYSDTQYHLVLWI